MLKNKHQNFKLVRDSKIRRVLRACYHQLIIFGDVDVTVQVMRNISGQKKYEPLASVPRQIEFRQYLCMTISVDHDAIDGAPGAHFALRLKELIENGYGLIDQDSAAKQSDSILQA